MTTDKLEALEREIREAPHPVRWCELEAWLKAWADRLAAIRAELGGVTEAQVERIKRAGQPLANIAYNLAQDDKLSPVIRESLDFHRKQWDAALNPTTGEGE